MNLFQRIEQILPTLGGWCPPEKAQMLAALVMATRPATVCELGVWTGASLIPMAMALKEIGSGMILGIDPWKADASVQGQIAQPDIDFWSRQGEHEQAYSQFMEKVNGLGLQDFVRVVRKTSNEVNPPDMDIIHVDANHGPQVLTDVIRFCPKVKQGGYCIMDDLGWTGGAVSGSISRLQAMGFRELYQIKNERGWWAVYQRR